jgi:hypothetical protein
MQLTPSASIGPHLELNELIEDHRYAVRGKGTPVLVWNKSMEQLLSESAATVYEAVVKPPLLFQFPMGCDRVECGALI